MVWDGTYGNPLLKNLWSFFGECEEGSDEGDDDIDEGDATPAAYDDVGGNLRFR